LAIAFLLPFQANRCTALSDHSLIQSKRHAILDSMMAPYLFKLTNYFRHIELAVQTPQEKNVRNFTTEERNPLI